MSAHFCNPFHHFIINLSSLTTVALTAWYTTAKSFQEGQSNLCLTLSFGCLSAALSTLQDHSSAPLCRTGESCTPTWSGAGLLLFFFPPLPWEGGSWICTLHQVDLPEVFFVTQFSPCLVAPLRTKKQLLIYILSSIKHQFFHKLLTPSHLTSHRSPKCEWGYNLASSF